MNSEVILIGNGSSVLDRQLGKIIDSFGRVIRFNSFKLSGFEDNVGTKTTDWYNTRLFSEGDFRFHIAYYRYVFHSWSWNKRPIKYEEMFSLVMADIKSSTNEKTTIEMTDFLGEKYKWFSTGAIAAWEMLKEFDRVHLFGFDWWERTKHHYGDGEIRGVVHKPDMEKRFFQKLGERAVFL